jgi:signal transduction histidine kinase
LLAPLVDNARRYASGAVEVHGERRDGEVVLVVDDDGPGVRPDDVEQVFVPGWRADPDDGHPGGGLGLALSRRLTEACGGSVRAVPREDGGRFEVVLPPA